MVEVEAATSKYMKWYAGSIGIASLLLQPSTRSGLDT